MLDNIYAYLVEIRIEKDDNGYYVYCPGLKGVRESGETKAEAIENARFAVLLILKARFDRGETLPESKHLIALRRSEKKLVTMKQQAQYFPIPSENFMQASA